MPLRRARSSMLRMAMPPVTLAVASSGLFSSEREFVVIGVSSQRDGLWLGGVHEGRGWSDGEHGDRRPATAGAAVTLRALVDRLVPAADDELVPAFAVAGGAGL